MLMSASVVEKPLSVRLAEAARALIAASGEDPSREALVRTPERFARAFAFLCSGYESNVESAIGEGIFPAEGSGLVAVRDIEFYSLCEHHLLPFWGRASVAYYPRDKILGLSKIPRLVDCFSRRLQVQERLTRDIAEAVVRAVNPRTIGVRIHAEHMCMRMRGVRKQGGETVTELMIGGDASSAGERDRLWNGLA